ncbi:hypothetical protein F383_27339 [Gossypium arboreum]|uniref:Uncharacterized protein n=1 Tax=Gossypium arboreum TaxID=29729 RepID=A0A0B0PD78_GOSAR|nr:hypothetical protein F383_27339 [Gossypium arboreum]
MSLHCGGFSLDW